MDGNESYVPCPQLRFDREVKQNGLKRASESAHKLWFQIDAEGGNSAPLKLTGISDPMYLQFLESPTNKQQEHIPSDKIL